MTFPEHVWFKGTNINKCKYKSVFFKATGIYSGYFNHISVPLQLRLTTALQQWKWHVNGNKITGILNQLSSLNLLFYVA